MQFDADYYSTHQRRGCIFIFITALARIAGLMTLVALAFVTYLEWAVVGGLNNFQIYVTIVTIIVAYLELLWLFDKCVSCCICCFRDGTCLYLVCCIPIDNWLKAILYIGLSVPFLIFPWFLSFNRTDVETVGILLIVTGLLYFTKTFKYKKTNPDDFQEDDHLFNRPKPIAQPSFSTQTSSTEINNDTLPSAVTVNEETSPKH